VPSAANDLRLPAVSDLSRPSRIPIACRVHHQGCAPGSVFRGSGL